MTLKNEDMGRKIKQIRLDLGKSQFEFGQLFDPPAPKSAVSRWEHGGSPNKKRLKKIAELGNVPIDFLTDGNLVRAVDNLYNFLYVEYENFQEYMQDDKNDVRSYITNYAEDNTSSRLKYQSMSELFSYIDLDTMFSGNVNQTFNECAMQVFKEAKAQHVKPSDENILLNLFVDVAKRRAFGLERNNKGLIKTLSDGIDELEIKIHQLCFGIDQNKVGKVTDSSDLDIVLPNSIDKELFNDVEKLLKDTKQKAKNLAKEFTDN